jgi:predicted patatin/cPLA2 family phospholipase
MNKRLDLLAKYLADLSKIFFSAVVVKQFIEHHFNPLEFTIGVISAIALFVIAYFIQPKE